MGGLISLFGDDTQGGGGGAAQRILSPHIELGLKVYQASVNHKTAYPFGE